MTKSSAPSDYWFIFQGDYLLIPTGTFSLLTPSQLGALQAEFLRQHTLGAYNECVFSCAELPESYPLPETFIRIPFKKALDLLGDEWYVMATKAHSIIAWDKNHRYCGHCGALTQHRPGNSFERVCDTCGQIFYPRISPSMIVLISKGDELLMARGPHFSPGAYGLIAGFVEAGESIENTVHREVFEEVGIQIKHLTYFGSQAWPFPDSLMIAFTAEYASGELVIDHDEIETAGWYRYDNLPGRPSYKISLSSKLIDHFITQRTLAKGI